MRLAHRFGAIAAAGLLACGSLGAAQTTPQEPSPTPTEEPSADIEETPATSEVPDEPEPEQTSDEDDPVGDTALSCSSEYNSESSLLEITFSNESKYDELTVEVGGVSVDPVSVETSTVRLPLDYANEPYELFIWQGKQLQGECAGQLSDEPDDEPTAPEPTETETSSEPTEPETPSDPGEPEPTDPGTPEPTDPGTPEPTDPGTPEPTDPGTPEPTDPDTPSDPTQSPEENPDTQPTSPAQTAPPETHVPLPSTPQPSTPRSSPTNEAPPVAPPSGGWNDTPTQPPQQSTPSTQPSTQSTEPVERDIRPYSNNPRHLLSEFWGTDSHNGSRLIMPGPRDSESQPNELETLPPVSEDELDAIKAQQATQDNGQGVNSDDELTGTDIGQRLSDSQSWWLLSTVAGIVVLGGGIWWAVSTHRNRQH